MTGRLWDEGSINFLDKEKEDRFAPVLKIKQRKRDIRSEPLT